MQVILMQIQMYRSYCKLNRIADSKAVKEKNEGEKGSKG